MTCRSSFLFGPCTEIDVLGGKSVRRDKDGFDVYEDYWTDSEYDSGSKHSDSSDFKAPEEKNTFDPVLIIENLEENKSDDWEVSICTSSQKCVQISTRSAVSINVHCAKDDKIRVSTSPAENSQSKRNLFLIDDASKSNSKSTRLKKQSVTVKSPENIHQGGLLTAKSADIVKDESFFSNETKHSDCDKKKIKIPFMCTQKIKEILNTPKRFSVPVRNYMSAKIPVHCYQSQVVENQYWPLSTVGCDEYVERLSNTQEHTEEKFFDVPQTFAEEIEIHCPIELGGLGNSFIEEGRNDSSPSFQSKSFHLLTKDKSTHEGDNYFSVDHQVVKPSNLLDEVFTTDKHVDYRRAPEPETKGFKFGALAFDHLEIDTDSQVYGKKETASHSSVRNLSGMFWERRLIADRNCNYTYQDSAFVEGKNLNSSCDVKPATLSANDFKGTFQPDNDSGLEDISYSLMSDFRVNNSTHVSPRKRINSDSPEEGVHTDSVEASLENNCRRSKRQKYPPLEHWRNQRLMYRFENGQIKCLGINNGTPEDQSSINYLHRACEYRMNNKLNESRLYKVIDNDQEFLVQLAQSFSTVPWPIQYAEKSFRAKLLLKTENSYIGYIEIDGLSSKSSRCLSKYDLHLTLIRGRVEITIQNNIIQTFYKDVCFVPRGNKYCIKNLRERKALLSFSFGKFKFLGKNVE